MIWHHKIFNLILEHFIFMILILSKNGDATTNLVIDWLNYYSYPFMRINISDTYNTSWCVDLSKHIIIFNQQEIPLDKINVVWYRKFGIRWGDHLYKNGVAPSISEMLSNEYKTALDTLFYILKDKRWLTNSDNSRLNKCKVLLKAQSIGLSVPKTYIVNSKQHISDIIKENDKKFIFKSIYDMIMIKNGDNIYNMFTKELTPYHISLLPDRFFPSLIQENIDKRFEIRAFYINGHIYSAALFSQNSNETIVDSRIVNLKKPIRYIPYLLSKDEEMKIIELMTILNLNCGSIDLIRAKSGELFFLEVNPVGEFGHIELTCNYGLHKIVATELIKMDRDGIISK